MDSALQWRSTEHKQLTREEYVACELAHAPVGRLYVYHVLDGVRSLRAAQAEAERMGVRAWREAGRRGDVPA